LDGRNFRFFDIQGSFTVIVSVQRCVNCGSDNTAEYSVTHLELSVSPPKPNYVCMSFHFPPLSVSCFVFHVSCCLYLRDLVIFTSLVMNAFRTIAHVKRGPSGARALHEVEQEISSAAKCLNLPYIQKVTSQLHSCNREKPVLYVIDRTVCSVLYIYIYIYNL
jgi:hypothetical protein